MLKSAFARRADRIEEATTAVQLFINRARLGLEPAFVPTPSFLHAWERRFGGFRRWQNCKRREIYRENWIDWDRTELARKSEAFAFFEDEFAPVRRDASGARRARALVGQPAASASRDDAVAETRTVDLDGARPAAARSCPSGHARTTRATILAFRRLVTTDPVAAATTTLTGRSAPRRFGTGCPAGPLAACLNRPGCPCGFRRRCGWVPGSSASRPRRPRLPAPATSPSATANRIATVARPAARHIRHLSTSYYFWIEDSEIYQPVEQIAEWGALPDDPVTGIAGDPQSRLASGRTNCPGFCAGYRGAPYNLRWCRVHNGEFQTPRKSAKGIEIADNATPDITLAGREGDSLTFSITGGLAREGHPANENLPFPAPGFRYDIAPDDAVLLPEVVTPTAPDTVGGLSAFPYFAWHCPGASILPRDRYAMAVAAAGHLATHCRYEDALRWLNLIWNPLAGDNTWAECDPRDDTGSDDPGPNDPVPIGARGAIVGNAVVDIPATAPPRRRGHLRPRRCCCPSEPVSDAIAARRFVTLRRLDILLDWSDALMRRNTPEAFGQARLLVDTVNRILGTMPATVVETPHEASADTIATVTLACAPLNPRLMCLYDRASDRLGLIHACLNARRICNGTPNVDMPYFGDDTMRECWKLDGDLCLDEAFWCRPASPYRFLVLVGRAQELAGELRSLGAQLLSAFEKGDAEYLSQLRVMHERQINDLMLKIREDQWRDADWQVQAIEKNKAIALTNLTYYKNLIAAGLLSGEAQYDPLTITSTTLRTAGNVVEAIGQRDEPDPRSERRLSLQLRYAAAGQEAGYDLFRLGHDHPHCGRHRQHRCRPRPDQGRLEPTRG